MYGQTVKLLAGTQFGQVGAIVTLSNSVAIAEIAAGRAVSCEADPPAVVNSQNVASYTAALSDSQQMYTETSATATSYVIPPNSAVAFPVGTVLSVIQYGAGTVTFVAGQGVTINTPSSLASRAQYSTISVVQVAPNVWVAGGDLQ